MQCENKDVRKSRSKFEKQNKTSFLKLPTENKKKCANKGFFRKGSKEPSILHLASTCKRIKVGNPPLIY